MQEVVTPAQEVAAGVLAGVADAVACHPVDVVKTQFHVNRTANGSMSAALLAQARAGGVASLYRGLPAACLRPQALCMYAGNEWAKARDRAHGFVLDPEGARSRAAVPRSASWPAAAS